MFEVQRLLRIIGHSLWLPLLVVVPVLLWLIWGMWGIAWFASRWPDNGTLERLGQAGDLFGGINALFAAFAFVGVAVAAWFQFETFSVVKQQAAEARIHQAQQAFEPLFFKLLELSREVRPTKLMHMDQWRGGLSPDEAATHFSSELAKTGWAAKASLGFGDNNEGMKVLEDLYAGIYSQSEQLGPFFRSLYHLFKRIDSSGLPWAQRIEYANIARATIEPAELFLLAVNCMTRRGVEFRPLIAKYGLLKHLPGERDRRSGGIGLLQTLWPPAAFLGTNDRATLWGFEGEPTTLQAMDMHPPGEKTLNS